MPDSVDPPLRSDPRDPDIIDLVDQAVDRRVVEADDGISYYHGLQERDAAFDQLRESMPLLHDDETASRMVDRALHLANRWDPRIIDSPAFTDLIRVVTLAAMGERAAARDHAPPAAPEVTLEPATGGTPDGSRTQNPNDYWGNRMLAAAKQLRPDL